MRTPIVLCILSLPLTAAAEAGTRAEQTHATLGKRGFSRSMRDAAYRALSAAASSQGTWRSKPTLIERRIGFVNTTYVANVHDREDGATTVRTRSHKSVIRGVHGIDNTDTHTATRTRLIPDGHGNVVSATVITRDRTVDSLDGSPTTSIATLAATEKVASHLGGLVKVRTRTETTRTRGPRGERDEDTQRSAHLLIGAREFKLPASWVK